MTDLLAFLAAQHSADEQAARDAMITEPTSWVAPNRSAGVFGAPEFPEDDANWAEDVVMAGHAAVAAHIARHDPQSVLARVEAERMLMSGHEALGADLSAQCANTCAACYREELPCDDRRVQMPCPTLRALAWGYRRREGFDSAWAPEGVSADA